MPRPRPPVTSFRVLLVAACVFSPASLATQEQNSQSPDLPEVVRFNVSPDGFPPYVIIEERDNGEEHYSGIFWDVLQEMADHGDFTIEAHKVPRKRVDQMLLDGYIDATPRAIEWTEKSERFLFTQPVMQLTEVFFTRKDSDFVYREPSDLDGKTIVTHLGYRYPAIEHKFEAGDAVRFDVQKHREILGFLMHSSRFHAAIADIALGEWVMKEQGWQGEFTYAGNELSDYDFRLMVRDDWRDFVTLFDSHLETLKESGRLEEIRNRYR